MEKNIRIENGIVYITPLISNYLHKILIYRSRLDETSKYFNTSKLEYTVEDFIRVLQNIIELYEQDDFFHYKSNIVSDYYKYKKILLEKSTIFSYLRDREEDRIPELNEEFVEELIIASYHFNLYSLQIEAFESIIRNLNSILLNLMYLDNRKEGLKYAKGLLRVINKDDILGTFEYINFLNNIFKKEWDQFENKFDEDNFMFLGHSVTSVEEYKDSDEYFYTSCSLFTNNVVHAYNKPFGFIMEPTNVVAAFNRDLYIDNKRPDDLAAFDHIFKYPIICSVTLTSKPDDYFYHNDSVADNEVVLRNFKPVGIFCFTFGIEGYKKSTYEAFKKFYLNNFKYGYNVYIFDILEHARGCELDSIRYELLCDLYTYAYDVYTDKIEKNENYYLFFEELSNMKKSETVLVDDVIDLFKHYFEKPVKKGRVKKGYNANKSAR